MLWKPLPRYRAEGADLLLARPQLAVRDGDRILSGRHPTLESVFLLPSPECRPAHADAFVMNDRSLFGFAGLWERWTDNASSEVILSFTIITTTPNDVCAAVHDRMPVIVEPKNYAKWLGEEPIDPLGLLMMLRSFPAERMEAFAVDPRVGNTRNDDPALLVPIAA